MDALLRMDERVLMFVHDSLRSAVLNPIMTVITYLGSAGAIWILLGVLLLLWKKRRVEGVYVLAALLMCLLLNNLLLKNLVARARPFEVISGIEMLIKTPTGFSFPSGHACASFAAAFAVVYGFGKRAWYAYILAVLIAFSRVYLCVHYPSDVLGGAVIGTLIGAVTCPAAKLVVQRLRKRGT